MVVLWSDQQTRQGAAEDEDAHLVQGEVAVEPEAKEAERHHCEAQHAGVVVRHRRDQINLAMTAKMENEITLVCRGSPHGFVGQITPNLAFIELASFAVPEATALFKQTACS
jgi:hypothetical protein